MPGVPFLDLYSQFQKIESEVREAIDRVLEDQDFILGPEVERFEREIGRFCGTRYGVGVSSGTDALLVSLMAEGVGPGDEVVTTAYSFIATANVIARLGATPVFVDINPETWNLEPRSAVSAIGPRTKAVIPVHLFGRCVELEPIKRAASEHDAAVIEDAAQAIGARNGNGRPVGSLGNYGCFSFFPTKNLGGFGDGGMVVTGSPERAEKLRMLRAHGGKNKYHNVVIGGNFRLDELQAAVLRVKLGYLDRWTRQRRKNASRYRDLFDGFGLVGTVTIPEDVGGHVYNQFVVRVPDRDGLREYLDNSGVETAVYYPRPLHLQRCFAKLSYKQGDFPHAEAAAEEALALPIFPELTDRQQEYVVANIADYYAS